MSQDQDDKRNHNQATDWQQMIHSPAYTTTQRWSSIKSGAYVSVCCQSVGSDHQVFNVVRVEGE